VYELEGHALSWPILDHCRNDRRTLWTPLLPHRPRYACRISRTPTIYVSNGSPEITRHIKTIRFLHPFLIKSPCMIKHIHLKNYRSFVDAEVDLAPLTLVLGANGAGKTNFLRAFRDCGPFIDRKPQEGRVPPSGDELPKHFNHILQPVSVKFTTDNGDTICNQFPPSHLRNQTHSRSVMIFHLDPAKISQTEITVANPYILPDGSGTTRTLETLKNGDQEELFQAAHKALITYVPEILKLSFADVENQNGHKQMQVKERGIDTPVHANQLSDGTRIIIGLLAIIHQSTKPPVICLEDIDYGMHPRVFEQVITLMQRIARDQHIQIIGTTHNPYLVDCFQKEPQAVVVVEKKDGASTLATLAQKLGRIHWGVDAPADMPLGNLWFSGFLGGVPEFLRPKKP